MAGRNTGRLRSNVKPEADPKDDAILDVLDAMELAAMVWHETFERIAVRLEATTEATAIALTEARREATEAAESLERLRDRATTLPDGRRVYRDQNGNAYTEDGGRIPDDEAATIKRADGAPSLEDYRNADRRDREARRRLDEIERYNERLNAIRQRLNGATPGSVSQEELERLEAELDRDMPDSVRQTREQLAADRPNSPARQATSTPEPEQPEPAAKPIGRPAQSDLDAVAVSGLPKVSLPTPS